MAKKIQTPRKKVFTFNEPYQGSEVKVVLWNDEGDNVQEQADRLWGELCKKGLTIDQRSAIIQLLGSSISQEQLFG